MARGAMALPPQQWTVTDPDKHFRNEGSRETPFRRKVTAKGDEPRSASGEEGERGAEALRE